MSEIENTEPKPLKTILVVDDEESLRVIIRNALKRRGYQVETADHGKKASTLLTEKKYDAVLLDIRIPGMDGFSLLEQVRRQENPPPVIMITAEDTMKNAIEAMKRGAFDYLAKPFDVEELEVIVEKALRERALEVEVEKLREEVREIREEQVAPNTLVGHSKPIRELHKLIGKLAAMDVTVLVQGESGTGKELIARAIHRESPRAMHPFMAVNVAAIPKDLLEGELFGHVRGAFTGANEDRTGYFEKVGKGTLFLDEIGDMPLSLQAKILRVLQEKEVTRLGSTSSRAIHCRVITATHQNLEKMVKEKKFREDLYYRLNVVPVEVAPLRMRKEDIALLANHFLQKFCVELGTGSKVFSKETLVSLKKYAWPGNVRELENIVKRSIVLSPGTTISQEVVEPFLSGQLPQMNLDEIAIEDLVRQKLQLFLSKWDGYDVDDLYDVVIQRVEKPLIELVLQKTEGNQLKAAKMLGINRNTLHKKLKTLKIALN